MLSRVANSIYWMSRYIERAENVARFVHVNQHLLLDIPLDETQQWRPLIVTSGDRADFEARYDGYSQASVIEFLTFDPQNPNSIVSCLHQARENARTVREAISSEMWEQVNRFYLSIRSAASRHDAMDEPHVFYTDVKMNSHLFVGITDTTMSHNEGWHFARLGRVLERADKTARILDVKYFMLLPTVDYIGTPFDSLLWSALLKSASGFEMYRKRHHRIHSDTVVAFLMLDSEFPRSMRWCLNRAEDSLRFITGSQEGSYANTAERKLGRLCSDLDYAAIDEIMGGGLHEFLDGFQTRLNEIGQAVYEGLFALNRAMDVEPSYSVSE